MAQLAQTHKEELAKKRQSKLIKHLKKEETYMKWGLVAAGIIILLLLLYIGYATDWTTGLKTDSANQPDSTSLDSAKTAQSGTSTTPSSGGTSGGSSQGSTSTNSTTNTGGTGTDTTRTGTSSTTNNSTTERTTTNNTTTNNNTTTPTTPTTPDSSALLNLYADAHIGDTLDSIISRANANNITVDCQDLLLVRTCTLSLGDTKVQIRGLLSTGLVTSVLNIL